jgi:Prokaryotic homologs of the JAB domain
MAARRMREVCFLIGEGETILWGDAAGGPSAMPDSRARWEAIWRHRRALREIAHSHPHGPSAFSSEDETTMAAIASGLGTAPRFSVVAPRTMIAREGKDGIRTVDPEPWWAGLMRLASGMEPEETKTREQAADQEAAGEGE